MTDPTAYDDVWSLRASVRLPARARRRGRVLGGHGTAWSVVVADLTGQPADLSGGRR